MDEITVIIEPDEEIIIDIQTVDNVSVGENWDIEIPNFTLLYQLAKI